MKHVPEQDTADEILKVLLNEIVKTKKTFLYEPLQGDQVTRSEFVRWARSIDYEPMIVWVQTDDATSLKRARKNGLSREEYDTLVHKFNQPHAIEKPVVVSGKHTKPSQARTILNRIIADRPVESVQVPPRQPASGRKIQL